jgi:Ankyrin repeat
MPARDLPPRPNLRQLRHQAKDLLRAFRRGDHSAVADFREDHAERVDPANATLADAQLVLARSYHAPSWSQLVLACRIIEATSRDDFEAVRELVEAHPEVVRQVATDHDAGWQSTMASAADLGLRRVIVRLRDLGVRGITAAVAKPELRQWLDALRLLGRIGGRPPADVVGGAVELLKGADLAFMVEVGADVRHHKGLVALALETYARDPEGKHRILDVMAKQGIVLPDTPPMALHRGRIDLLERHLHRDRALLARTFSHREIYPPELECHADEDLALVGAPLSGATLLHIATEYEEAEVVGWLLDKGMNVNVRAEMNSNDFGGHTALFNCVVTYNSGRQDASLARLLLDRGGDPNLRASIRKRLPFARDTSVHEYRDVTPLGWAGSFMISRMCLSRWYVCSPSVAATNDVP